jgi:hypothetical protein
MGGGAVLVLLGITALGAYSVGRQSAPVSNAPVPAITSPSALAQPVAFVGPAAQARAPVPARNASSGLTPSTTNQAAIIALFWVMNRYVGNLPPVPSIGVTLMMKGTCRA